jgi:O-antigen ligase
MDKVLELILALVIIGATLAFGGVQPVAYSPMEAVLFLLVLVLLLKQSRTGKISLPIPLWPLLFVVWVVLQLIPLPARLVMIVSPTRVAGAQDLAQASSAWITISIYPEASLTAIIKFLAYFGAFVLAAYLFDSSRRKSTLLNGLLALGVFEAGYGMFQYLAKYDRIFTYRKEYDLGVATGTFINRNHFAGLLEMIMPMAAASAFYFLQRWGERPRVPRGRHAPSGGSSLAFQATFYMFLALVMGLGVVFSLSRGGILSTAISLVFISLLAQLKAGGRRWMLTVIVFLAAVIGYGLWIGLDPALARFEAMREKKFVKMEERAIIWKDTLKLVRAYTLVGSGFGTYGIAFRPYQTGLVTASVDHAHNDYLEFASETGLVGAALVFLPILYLCLRMAISFLTDTRRYRRMVTLGCIGATLALLLHSFTDFNLQIPANALCLAVVLGMGYKAACIEPREEPQATAPPIENRAASGKVIRPV